MVLPKIGRGDVLTLSKARISEKGGMADLIGGTNITKKLDLLTFFKYFWYDLLTFSSVQKSYMAHGVTLSLARFL